MNEHQARIGKSRRYVLQYTITEWQPAASSFVCLPASLFAACGLSVRSAGKDPHGTTYTMYTSSNLHVLGMAIIIITMYYHYC